MNRIDQKFEDLKKKKQTAFIAFITAGDPGLKATEDLVIAFEKAGVDIVELGVPFSDPLADGPTIQAASQRALKKGVTLNKILGTVKNIRKKSQMPIALMTYYNPVFQYGEKRFVKDARQSGVDGLIVPDLPPEEAKVLIAAARKEGVSLIFFISPTTTKKRMKEIVKVSTGFIYYVSLAGVTGARKKLPSNIVHNVSLAKKITDKPICVGFGISQPQQVRDIGKIADGVIVGSAIIKEINKYAKNKNLTKLVTRSVSRLVVGRK